MTNTKVFHHSIGLLIMTTLRLLTNKKSSKRCFFCVECYGAVDLRSRRFAFRGKNMKNTNYRLFHKQFFLGAGAEPPRRRWRLRGLTCPANPAGL
jgi:hypothetical protein